MIKNAKAPVPAVLLPMFSGWYSVDRDGKECIRGEFSDIRKLSCSIEENLTGDSPTILLGQNYAFKEEPQLGQKPIPNNLLSLSKMELTQHSARQLVAVLNHFIDYGHLKK